MNTWIGIGRATKDCEINTTANGTNIAKFTIAVDRKFKDADGNKVTDFINIIAWRGLADICYKYVKKGQQVAIKGELQIRSYDAQDGSKRYVTEIVADDVTLLGNKNNGETSSDNGENVNNNHNNAKLTPIADADNLPF